VNTEADRTLEELEGDDWGEPKFSSYVVTTCHRLRRKPVRDLTDEELRLATGQQMGLQFLLPIAIKRLQSDPLASGDMYPGALLENVLAAAMVASLDEKRLRDLDGVVMRYEDTSNALDDGWRDECQSGIANAVAQYRRFRVGDEV
jgi:hypothetical protein